MLRSPVFWVLTSLLVLFIYPPTRKWVVNILPTGRNLDDILFWVALVSFSAYLFWTNIIRPRRMRKRRLTEQREYTKVLQVRIQLLMDYIFRWVGESDPEMTLLYEHYKTPTSLENAQAAFEIWVEAEKSFQDLRGNPDIRNLPQLEQIYTALVGYPLPDYFWFKLLEQVETAEEEGVRDEPIVARLLARTRDETQQDWPISLGGSLSTQSTDPVKGALSYILDPENQKKSERS